MPLSQLPISLDSDVSSLAPYWQSAVDAEKCGGTITVVNDDSRFSLKLDVTQFRPEEIKMSLDGRKLTVQGQQQTKRENAVKQRSFLRSWTLPPDVIKKDMKSSLSNEGILHIEGPKVMAHPSEPDAEDALYY